MSIRISFQGNAAAKWQQAMKDGLSRMSKAVAATARQGAALIEARGRADIAAAGKFSGSWLTGLHANVEPKTGALINAVITVSHDIQFFNVFETGKTIQGKPLLWIPLSYTGDPTKISNYASELFRVDRKSGPPLLFSVTDRLPKFVGVSSVTLRKRFHITDIISKVVSEFKTMYEQNMREIK